MFLSTVRTSRREFLIAVGATGAGVVAVLLVGCGDDGEPDVVMLAYAKERIAALSELRQGEPLDFAYPAGGQQNFVVKLGEAAQIGVGPEEDIVAFSYLCTHMGCPLIGQYKDEHKIMGPCPCHFTTFDLRHNGMVVLGQATQNLPQIALLVEGDDIYATGVIGLFYGAGSNLRDARVEVRS
ncbi:MAG: arsenate reductase (azurin) small subunit [Chloroflexi bacterium]|nr:arsenate reductase (azurin) small subunit [Chloroflexota bacterium]